jgi:hypothetical protein
MRLRKDLYSKIIDGILTSGVLLLILLVITMLMPAAQTYFGRPGALVLGISLLAVAVILFEHALTTHSSEYQRIWFGMAGGLVAWRVVALSNLLGGASLSIEGSALLFILVALLIGCLWRNHLVEGARFFSAALLMSWAGSLLLTTRLGFFRAGGPLEAYFSWFGYASLAGAAVVIIYILFYSKDRNYRMGAALALCFFVAMAVDIFKATTLF